MKAGENYLVKFLQQQDTQFIIPVYQRNYDWTHKHCEQLLKDIKHVAGHEKIPSHFKSSLMLQKYRALDLIFPVNGLP